MCRQRCSPSDQRRTVLSDEPERRCRPSSLTSTARMLSVCPTSFAMRDPEEPEPARGSQTRTTRSGDPAASTFPAGFTASAYTDDLGEGSARSTSGVWRVSRMSHSLMRRSRPPDAIQPASRPCARHLTKSLCVPRMVGVRLFSGSCGFQSFRVRSEEADMTAKRRRDECTFCQFSKRSVPIPSLRRDAHPSGSNCRVRYR